MTNIFLHSAYGLEIISPKQFVYFQVADFKLKESELRRENIICKIKDRIVIRRIIFKWLFFLASIPITFLMWIRIAVALKASGPIDGVLVGGAMIITWQLCYILSTILFNTDSVSFKRRGNTY